MQTLKMSFDNAELSELMNCDGLHSGKFLIKVEGDSMTKAGINEGDLLLADMASPPGNGDIALVKWNGAFVVKRVFYRGRKVVLCSESEKSYPPITVPDIAEIEMAARVLSSIKHIN